MDPFVLNCQKQNSRYSRNRTHSVEDRNTTQTRGVERRRWENMPSFIELAQCSYSGELSNKNKLVILTFGSSHTVRNSEVRRRLISRAPISAIPQGGCDLVPSRSMRCRSEVVHSWRTQKHIFAAHVWERSKTSRVLSFESSRILQKI